MLIAIAVGAVASTVALWIAALGGFGPMFGLPAAMTLGPMIVGAAGVAFGLAWMVRIYREDPEPDHRAWRYRERD